jgi:hypothetical protein
MQISYLKGVAVPEVRLWWPLNPSFRFFPFFIHRLIVHRRSVVAFRDWPRRGYALPEAIDSPRVRFARPYCKSAERFGLLIRKLISRSRARARYTGKVAT